MMEENTTEYSGVVYSIKDIERLSGIKAHTIRIWEQRYNVVQPVRTDSNIRTYSNNDLRRILNIALLNKHGFRISKIVKMNEDEVRQQVLYISGVSTEKSILKDALTLALIQMDEERFEKQLATVILKFGLEQAMVKVIQPFLYKIGVLWQTGAIHPAQEHFFSNLIRQKLIVAIDGQDSARDSNDTWMLFLPEGELHELGLLFMHYLLKKRGKKVIYLGASVPFKDVVAVFQVHKPKQIFCVCTSYPEADSVSGFVSALHESCENSTLFFSGNRFLESVKPSLNFKSFNSLEEGLNYLDT